MQTGLSCGVRCLQQLPLLGFTLRLGLATLLRLDRLGQLNIQMLQVVGDGQRFVGLAFGADAVGPDAVGEVRPVVVAGFEGGPAFFEALLPRRDGGRAARAGQR